MHDHGNEAWVGLYRIAVCELKQSLMAGRILDARSAIAMRVIEMEKIPESGAVEKQAIEDALSGLGGLEHEDNRLTNEAFKMEEASR